MIIERSSKQKTINKYSSNKARARESACGPLLPGHTRCMDYSERPHTPTGKLPPYLAAAVPMENFSDEPPVKTDTATGDAAAKFKLKPGRSVGNVAAIAAALTAGISPIHRRHRGRYIGPGRTAEQDSRFNDQCKRYHSAKRKLAFWTRVTLAEANRRRDDFLRSLGLRMMLQA